MLRSALAFAMLLTAAPDVHFGPESGFDDPPTVFAWASNIHAGVAHGGSTYLIVWERDVGEGRGPRVFGARLAEDGTLLDPRGFRVCDFESKQTEPAVVYDGANFRVVWVDDRTEESGLNLYGATVSTAGAVGEPDGAALITIQGDQHTPRLASSDSNILLTYRDERAAEQGVYGTRLASDWTLLDTQIHEIAAGADNPRAAFGDGTYFVCWDAGNGALFSPTTGAVGSPIDVTGCDDVAYGGGYFSIVWTDLHEAYGRRVQSDGTVLDGASGVQLSANGGAVSAGDAAVAYNGTDYLVTWTDDRNAAAAVGFDVFARRVDPSTGAADGAEFTVSTADASAPAAAGDGAELSRRLRTRHGPSGAPRRARGRVRFRPRRHRRLDARRPHAKRPRHHVRRKLLSRRVERASRRRRLRYLRRARHAGGNGPRRGRPRDLDRGGRSKVPDVAWNGEQFVVVWEDFRSEANNEDIYAAFVDEDTGSVGSEIPIVVHAATQDELAHACNPATGECVITWSDRRTGDRDLWGVGLDADGNLSPGAGGALIVTQPNSQRCPDMAFGASFFVTWEDCREGPCDIYGAMLDADAAIEGDEFMVAGGDNTQGYPSIATDGTIYLVAYEDRSNGADTGYDIRVMRVTMDGTLLDGPADDTGVLVSREPLNENYPAAIFDGTFFQVGWETEIDTHLEQDLLGLCIDASADGMEFGPLTWWTADPGMECHLAMASAQSGDALAANEHFVGFDEGAGEMLNAVRLRRRFVSCVVPTTTTTTITTTTSTTTTTIPADDDDDDDDDDTAPDDDDETPGLAPIEPGLGGDDDDDDGRCCGCG
ncbi:MAG: hypothetical protein M5R36_28125 [Deltaproteobacteria bacterium]|nr:hypothetical protein [Deltaproteobacteria bacterium]